MRRGEIWTVAGTGYGSKPRPALIIQDDAATVESVTVILFTSTPVDAPLIRMPIDPTPDNGLDTRSWLMVDKITTLTRTKARQRLGRLSDDQLRQLAPMILVFLGLGR